MDNPLAALIGGLIVICFGAWLLSILITLAIVTFVFFGPVAGLGYALRSFLQRYELSRRQKIRTAAIGAGLFMVPLLLLPVVPSQTLTILWIATMLGTGGSVLYLVIETSRQFFWEYRRIILASSGSQITRAVPTLLTRLRLAWAGRDLRRIERDWACKSVLEEQKKLRRMIERIIEEADTDFFSSEKIRCERGLAEIDGRQLEEIFEETRRELSETATGHPRHTTLVFKSTLMRLKLNEAKLPKGNPREIEVLTADCARLEKQLTRDLERAKVNRQNLQRAKQALSGLKGQRLHLN